MTRRIDNLIRHVADHRWPWLAALAIVTAILGAGLLRLEIATAPDEFLVDGSEEQADYNQLRDLFGSDENGLVLIELDDPLHPDNLARYIDLHQRLEEVPLVNDGGYVQSLVTSRDEVGQPLLTGEIDLNDPALEDRILNAPLVANRLVSTEPGASYLALVTRISAGPEPGTYWDATELAGYANGIFDVLDNTKQPDFEPVVASEVTLATRAADAVGLWIGVALAGQIVLVAIFVGIIYGGRAALLPILTIGLTLIATLGTMGWFGVALDAFAQILPNLIVVAGVADSVHLVHRFASTWGPDNDQSAAAAGATVDKLKPIAFTSVTSAAGFASFALGGFAPFAIVGAFGALAVLVAMAVSLILAPALLPTLVTRPPRALNDKIGTFADRTAQWSAKRAVPIGLATAALCLASVVGITRTDIRLDAEALAGDLGGAEDIARVAELQDGALPLQVVYANAEGVLTPDAQQRADEITSIMTNATIGGTSVRAEPSIWNAIESVIEITEQLGLTEDPPSPSAAVDTASAQETQAIATLINQDRTAVRLPFTTGFVAQTVVARDSAALQDELDNLAQGEEEILLTGIAVASGRSAETALPSVVRSYGVALMAIALLVGLAVRGRQRAFIAMVPNILPAFLLLGFLGIAGIPVDLAMIPIAAIVIGISVDDTIHVVHDAYLDPNRSPRLSQNLSRSMRETGPALILTSTLIAIGLVALALLPIPTFTRIGPIGGVAVLLALAADLIVLPALMSLLDDLEQHDQQQTLT